MERHQVPRVVEHRRTGRARLGVGRIANVVRENVGNRVGLECHLLAASPRVLDDVESLPRRVGNGVTQRDEPPFGSCMDLPPLGDPSDATHHGGLDGRPGSGSQIVIVGDDSLKHPLLCQRLSGGCRRYLGSATDAPHSYLRLESNDRVVERRAGVKERGRISLILIHLLVVAVVVELIVELHPSVAGVCLVSDHMVVGHEQRR